MNTIISAFIQQMPVQPRHEIEILPNRLRPVTTYGAHQVRSKHSKCPGDNRQHVPLRPGFSTNQKRPQILDYLDRFDRFAWQPHTAQLPPFDLRTV